jgi:thiol-disulfide isomerase/thioredoxin
VTHDNSDSRERKEKGVLREDQNDLLGKGFSFSGYERDPLYLNLGTKKFLDISGVSGIDSITDGRAAVFADFDNDGDQDVFMTTLQGQAHLLFRNNVGQESKYLRVDLRGAKSGRDAFGAVVRVKTSAGILTKIKAGGSGYLSQHDPRLLFGLGQDERAEWLEVTWPSGSKQKFENIPSCASLRLTEGSDKFETLTEKPAKLPDPLTREQLLLQTLKFKLGEPFPALNVTTLAGKQGALRSFTARGHKTLVNLWATWCGPCAKEMPELERLQARLKANKIQLIGLSIDTDGIGVVRDYVKQKRVTYPIFVAGEQGLGRIYATDEASVPLSVLLDEQGRVLEVLSGWSKRTAERLERLTKP